MTLIPVNQVADHFAPYIEQWRKIIVDDLLARPLIPGERRIYPNLIGDGAEVEVCGESAAQDSPAK